MNDLQSLTKKELKNLIKEAILNEDKELLEEIFKEDKELLLEFPPAIPFIVGALKLGATVGAAAWTSDALGVTDNWYDKFFKKVDPINLVYSAATGKNAFSQSPDRYKSGWLSKGIGNLVSGKDFGEGIETENKSEITKRTEKGEQTARDLAQLLFNAMDGPGSGVDAVKNVLIIDPNIKPGTQEHLTMMGTWDEIYKEFDKVTKAEDDGDQDKDLIWWLDDEEDFPEEHKLMKYAVGLAKGSPEELRKAYPSVFDEGDEGEEEGDEVAAAAAIVGTPKAGASPSMGGHAILAGGAAAVTDAEDKLWQTYQTLKAKPASERSGAENELLDIFAAADE